MSISFILSLIGSIFLFKQKTAYEMRISDWSSDVCSSDLTSGAAASGGASFIVQLLPLLLIFVVFYFLLIRPQQKKMKEHRTAIEAVKKGYQVITDGGLVGKVVRVDDNYVEIGRASGREGGCQ